ncbi:MAG TPA: hypothetical protein VLS27_07660 [Gammaproteobacteria bacterium]|nr:hypothetical protein [Gammaproteobacteria bacterium]
MLIRILRPAAGVLLLQVIAMASLSPALGQGFNRHEPCGLGFALDPECRGEEQQPTGEQRENDGKDAICSGEKLDAIRDG